MAATVKINGILFYVHRSKKNAGNEQGFFVVLQPGETIEIGQTTNGFDSRHELSYGGDYPGDTSVICRDDPDTNTESYTNDGLEPVNVYYTVDAYSDGSGDFTLAWTITSKYFEI